MSSGTQSAKETLARFFRTLYERLSSRWGKLGSALALAIIFLILLLLFGPLSRIYQQNCADAESPKWGETRFGDCFARKLKDSRLLPSRPLPIGPSTVSAAAMPEVSTLAANWLTRPTPVLTGFCLKDWSPLRHC